MRHVVMFSGGLGSWATAKRVADKHGTDNLFLVFADVRGDHCTCGHRAGEHINGRGPCGVLSDQGEYCGCTRFSHIPHVGEDEDTYRFIEEAAANVGGQFVVVMDDKGRNIWQTFKRELREFLGSDVAILRDRSGGKSVPLTLTRFRECIDSQPDLFDDFDFGGCGCFVQEESATTTG